MFGGNNLFIASSSLSDYMMEYQHLPLFIASLIAGVYTSDATDQPVAVYFSLIVSNDPTINTSGIVSAVDQVLELINSNTTILPGYCLQYIVLNTQQVSYKCQPLA